MSAFLWCSLVVFAFLTGGMWASLWSVSRSESRLMAMRHEMERSVMAGVRSDFKNAFQAWLYEAATNNPLKRSTTPKEGSHE